MRATHGAVVVAALAAHAGCAGDDTAASSTSQATSSTTSSGPGAGGGATMSNGSGTGAESSIGGGGAGRGGHGGSAGAGTGGSGGLGGAIVTGGAGGTGAGTGGGSGSDGGLGPGGAASSAGGAGGPPTGNGGTGGTSGGGGGGSVCAPSQTIACYTGPASTLGVGDCLPGTATCLDDGTDYGPCEGEVVPQAETCLASGDEDCDGTANEEGAGCACVPGATQPCYSGPANTQGVGVCSAVSQTCEASGTAWGACTGEVLPGYDSCTTAADEDCDGASPACSGCALRLGDAAGEASFAQAVAIDANGNVVVVGSFEGILDAGGSPLVSPTQVAFVAKYDASCNHLWSKAFPSAHSGGRAVAVDSAGNVLVTGGFQASIDFGGASLVSTGFDDAYLVKLGPSGDPIWSKRFGDTGSDQFGLDVATDATDHVAVTGVIYGSGDFGGGTVVGNWFVASFASNGAHVWSKATSGGRGGHLAFDGGDLVLGGAVSGTLDLGGGPISSVPPGDDVFVTKFSPAGAVLWTRTFVTLSKWFEVVPAAVGGDVLVSGFYGGTLDAGSGIVLAATGNVFAARLSGPDGTTLWAKGFEPSPGELNDMTPHPNGDVTLVGSFGGTIDFGGGPFTSVQGDAYFAELTGSGAHVASDIFSGNLEQYANGVAIGPSGERVIVGEFESTVDFGFGPLTASFIDGFLVRYDP